ncbi:hypothetical protein C8F01DRAFT_1254448 [Mycena amicta]|nr:hypothetical protein C8F01DRAFT_1254448 [Mycena amicta]
MAATTTNDFSQFGSFKYDKRSSTQASRPQLEQRMRSMLLIPTGPAFRPRMRGPGPAGNSTFVRTQLSLSVPSEAASDDDQEQDQDDSASDTGSDVSSAVSISTTATSVYSSSSSPTFIPTTTVVEPTALAKHTHTPALAPRAPARPHIANKAPTQYLYQGGRTNVVSGGVMLGSCKPQPQSRPQPFVAVSQQTLSVPKPNPASSPKTKTVWRNSKQAQPLYRGTTGVSGSWRRPVAIAA